MMSKKKWWILTVVSLITAVIAHGFMLSEWIQDRYITGPNDGLSQMIPFKHFLYETMIDGNFFYSERFGLGGGTFSQLGYYFSTSIVFLLTAAVTALLQWTSIISTPGLQYWADVTVFVSIIRLTIILLMTTYYFRVVGVKIRFAYMGAVIYSISIFYFRHVTYWEFFADAMLFLPLLLIGAERIIRYGKPTVFILAIALSMIDNFYFAYINFLLTFLYILFRWFIRLQGSEWEKRHQIVQFVGGGLLGAALSAPFFVPAVYGYLNNFRPPFEGEIPLFDMTENILFNGKMVLLPAFAVVGIFLFPLYKNKLFRLFSVMMIVLSVLHASPAVGSLFNGFSAPQYRWEHMLMLVSGGVVAVALQRWKEFQWRHTVVAVLAAIGTYGLFSVLHLEGKPSLYSDSVFVLAFAIFVLVLVAKVPQLRHWDLMLYAGIVISTLITVNLFQDEKLTEDNTNVHQVQGQGIPQSFFTSDAYNAEIPRELIHDLTQAESDPLARFDWMIGTRNNTPIVQDFLGTSSYSSILNQHVLQFYWEDLAIDMGRESVSRYAGLGGRANLYSLIHTVYAVRQDKGNPIPYGFEEVATNEGYRAFENTNRLPFVRTTDLVFTEEALSDAPVLAREHAMLRGVVLDVAGQASEAVPVVENVMNQISVKPVRATYENNQLIVTGKDGGIDLNVSNRGVFKEDAYVSFYLKRDTSDVGFKMKVNDYKTTRKRTNSIYRTRVNDITIRVPAEEVIRIRIPEGSYALKDIAVHAEDYTTLEKAVQQSTEQPTPEVEWSGGHAHIQLNNPKNDTYAVMPIPFEKGWTARVNGQKVPVLKGNYAFTAIPIETGKNTIELNYRPPYFVPSLLIAMIGLVGAIYWLGYRKRTNSR